MHALLLHVIGDALGNVGVIATGLVIWKTNWAYKYYFDPFISLVITMIIFSTAMPLGTLPPLSKLDLFLQSHSKENLIHPPAGCSGNRVP